jgi:hypothetical protein
MQSSSASRQLYVLLQQACEHDGKAQSQVVWASILGADANSNLDVSQKLWKLLALFEDVIQEIQSLKVANHSRYLDPLNTLRLSLMLQPMIGPAWESTQARLIQHLPLLEACADVVESQGQGVFVLSAEDLESLKQSIRMLLDEILSLDIDVETKTFLVNELRKIEEALLSYQVVGSTGVARVSEEVVGRAIPRWEQAVDKSKGIIGKVIRHAIEIDKLIKAGGTFYKLAETLKDHLPLLPPM